MGNNKQQTPLTKLLAWLDEIDTVTGKITTKSVKEKAISLLADEEKMTIGAYKDGGDDAERRFCIAHGNAEKYFNDEFDQYKR
jgi:hypothetical protein